MSCTKNVQRGTLAAVKCGISRRASQAASFVGTYLGAIKTQTTKPFQGRWQSSQQTKVNRSTKPLPVLLGIEQVEPTPVSQLTGGRCGKCDTSVNESPGGEWYQIKGGQYCPNCAPDKAKVENLALSPAPVTSVSQAKSRFTPRLTTLQSKPVFTVGATDVQGYAVRSLGRDTGLLLTPEINPSESATYPEPVEGSGQIKTTGRWSIIYEKTGQPVGGLYANVKQAQAMASLLANVDWTRSPDQFTPTEVQQAGAMARQMRGDLGYYQDREQEKQLDGLWS